MYARARRRCQGDTRRETGHATYLLLLVIELLPSRAEELANLACKNPKRIQSAPRIHAYMHSQDTELRTETRVRVFRLDAFPPVLAEEHVRRQGALGCVAILAALLRLRALLGLLSGLALSIPTYTGT